MSTHTATGHEMSMLVLSVGDDPPFMYQAQCSCSWNGVETPDKPEAEADAREHLRVRREKATMHPWLDTK